MTSDGPLGGTAEAAGGVCPYCRFPLKEGASAVRCEACGTLHHEECWEEGGGCAVLGCVNAGTREAQSVAWPTAAPQPWGAPPIEPGAAYGPVPASRAGRNLLIGAAAALALAAVGAGAFIALRHGSQTPVSALQTDQGTTRHSGTSRSRTVTVPAQPTTVTTVETQTLPAQSTPSSGASANLAESGTPAVGTPAGDALQRYWTLVNTGRYGQAFAMETPHEQAAIPRFVSNRSVAQPKINVLVIGQPQVGSGQAYVWIKLYAQDRYPSPGSDTICRLFAMTVRMVQGSDGTWFYDGPVPGRATVIEQPASPNCHS